MTACWNCTTPTNNDPELHIPITIRGMKTYAKVEDLPQVVEPRFFCVDCIKDRRAREARAK